MIHAACPDVEETLTWSAPHFGFWKGSLILDAAGNKASEAMGQFGRITSLDDLPPKRRKGSPKPEPPVPDELSRTRAPVAA